MAEIRRPLEFGEYGDFFLQGVESPMVNKAQNGNTFNSRRYAGRAAFQGVKDGLLWYGAPKLAFGVLGWIALHASPLMPFVVAGDIAAGLYGTKKFFDMAYDGVQVLRTGFGRRTPASVR